MERIQALIGHFDLDPTRTLDVILDVFSDNIVHHHAFFRDLLRLSPWGRSAAARTSQRSSAAATAADDVEMSNAPADQEDHEPMEPDGGLEEDRGDFICAQVLGFKFSIYQVSISPLILSDRILHLP